MAMYTSCQIVQLALTKKFISYLINSFTPNSSQQKMELPLNYFK